MSLWISDFALSGLSRYSPIYSFILVVKKHYEAAVTQQTQYEVQGIQRWIRPASWPEDAHRGGNSEFWPLCNGQRERRLQEAQWRSSKGDISSVRGDALYIVLSAEMNIQWGGSLMCCGDRFSLWGLKQMPSGAFDLDGVGDGRGFQEGGDICIPMADSCWYMAEANTILKSNYPPVKKNHN